jgi:argininosuccinate lyase
MIGDLEPNAERMRLAAGRGYSTATDLADWLVRTLGMPFRDAHHVTGRIVKLAEDKGIALDAVSLAEMQGVEPSITEAVLSVLSVDNSVASRRSFGGTAPENVLSAAAAWRKRLDAEALSR